MRTRRRSPRRRITCRKSGAFLAVAGALLLPACNQFDRAPTANADGTPLAEQSSAATRSSGATLPGTREFGLTEEDFARHVERTQALVATCMAEAGFEYLPVNVSTVEAAQARVRRDPGMSRRAYKQKWGLGVTTRFDNPVRDTGLGPQNLRIFASLPAPDQVAYNRTLFGRNPKADFVFTLDEEDFSETGGCTRKAVARVFTASQLKGTFVNPKDVLVDSDKRIVAARHAWSTCMRSAGYDYLNDQDEIIGDFEERLDKLVGADDPTQLTGARVAALKAMQREEINVALADLDCQLKHTDKVYDQVELEVYGHPLG